MREGLRVHHSISANAFESASSFPSPDALTTQGRRTRKRLQRLETAMWRLVSRGTHPGKAGGFLRLWSLFERFAKRMQPSTVVPNSPYGIFRIRTTSHRGKPIELPDGTRIERGTRVGEIHLDNFALLRVTRNTKLGLLTIGRDELNNIAQWLVSDLKNDLVAIYGVTVLAPLARRFGFTPRDCKPTLHSEFTRIFMSGLLLVYNPHGRKRLGGLSKLRAQQVWISRNELLNKYGPNRFATEEDPAELCAG